MKGPFVVSVSFKCVYLRPKFKAVGYFGYRPLLCACMHAYAAKLLKKRVQNTSSLADETEQEEKSFSNAMVHGKLVDNFPPSNEILLQK